MEHNGTDLANGLKQKITGLQTMTTSTQPSKKLVCDIHGEYEPWRKSTRMCDELREDCPKCFEEKEKRARRMSEFKGFGNIPKRFQDSKFGNFNCSTAEQKKAHDKCLKYAEDFCFDGRSGVLIGSCGTGKTHLACAIARGLAYTGAGKARYETVVGAVRSIKQTYSRDSDITESEAIEHLVSYDLLILDEVGVQFGSDTEKLILYEIINSRYNEMKSTILISNLDLKAFTEFLGERVIDRMRESNGLFLVFEGESYRGKK